MNFYSIFGGQSYLYKTQSLYNKHSQRLSSGLRINSAADDAAGLAIATRMTSQVNGFRTGMRNVEDGISYLKTADSAAGSLTDVLQRMRELAVQANNGTYSDSDKTSMNKEMTDLKAEYDHIVSNTTFNNVNVMNNTNTVNINSGNGSYTITNENLTSTGGGDVDLESLSLTTATGPQDAITDIDAALEAISTARASYGASISALDRRIDLNMKMEANTAASRSRIQDADMALEMSELTKQNILMQSNMAVLKMKNQNANVLMNSLFNF